MIKLHQQLEESLKVRINSNSEIILGIKKLTEAGRFDKPKEVALFAIILDRLGKIEDEEIARRSLQEITDTPVEIEPTPSPVETATSPDAPQQPETTTPVQSPVANTPAEDTSPTLSELTPENIANPLSLDSTVLQ